jgi:hypothetical protein
MKLQNLLVVALLLSVTAAQGSELLLEKRITPGFVIPEARIFMTCSQDLNGLRVVETRPLTVQGPVVQFAEQAFEAQMKGEIEKGHPLVDAGQTSYSAKYKESDGTVRTVLLLEKGSRNERNKSLAARNLVQFIDFKCK